MSNGKAISEPARASLKRAAEPQDDSSNKRQQYEFEQFFNCPVLSDVTIRYGESGELTFHAHKVILSVRSSWFSKVFMSDSRKGKVNDIDQLHGDPAAIISMLQFMYGIRIELPNKNHYPVANILRWIEIYRVAEIYGIPSLCAMSNKEAHTQLWNWLDPYGPASPTPDEFCEIVAHIYKFLGADRKHPLVRIILSMVDRRPMMNVLRNGAQTPVLLIQASQEIPEFGRDLFLDMLDKSRMTMKIETGKQVITELGTITRVECPRCDKVWSRPDSMITTEDRHKGHCLLCGRFVEDWRKHQEV